MRKIKNIAIYGSCISRDPFTTAFNPMYKERFNCVITDQRHSFISTMQKKEEIDDNKLKIYPDTNSNRFISRCIKEDLNKSFINAIKNNKVDYLIIDVNFDVETGILVYDNNKIITNITHMDKTEFFKFMKNKKVINIFNNPKEYFNLWKEACNKFFEFIKTESPQTKIILAEVRALDIVQKSDGSLYKEHLFTPQKELKNVFFEKFENYIINNFEVYVIKFDKNTFLNENHRWGKHYVHYDNNYYTNFLNQVQLIDTYEEIKNKINFTENCSFTINDDKTYLNNLEKKYLELEERHEQNLIELSEIKKDLLKYLTARIDIITYGTEKGINIQDISDKKALKYYPSWIDKKIGSGQIIESSRKNIIIKFKCNEDSKLKIDLRSKDIRDINRKRFPIYIDYTKFSINDNIIFNSNKLVTHDKSYIYEKQVYKNEIINMKISWKPFNEKSNFLNI